MQKSFYYITNDSLQLASQKTNLKLPVRQMHTATSYSNLNSVVILHFLYVNSFHKRFIISSMKNSPRVRNRKQRMRRPLRRKQPCFRPTQMVHNRSHVRLRSPGTDFTCLGFFSRIELRPSCRPFILVFVHGFH